MSQIYRLYRPTDRSRKRLCIFIALLLCGLVDPLGSWGDSTAVPDARDILKWGTVEAGIAAGYWQAVKFANDAQSLDRSAVFILPRLGMIVTDEFRAGFASGNLEVAVEPFFARYTHPFAAESAGGSLLIKYNFLSFGRWGPFWDAGAGMMWTNLAPRIPEQSTQFNFVLETGPGTHYFLTNALALTGGVRYRHFSNAGLGERNTGINGVLAYIGVSLFLPR